MLLSALCFALINILVKVLTNSADLFPQIQEYPVFEIVFFRSIISLIICSAIIKRKRIPFFGNNKKWLLIRGFAGFTALTLFFFTLKNLPLAISISVQYLSPIFTILFAIRLQKEKVAPYQWIFFFISLMGVVVIGYFKDPNLHFNPLWLGIGIVSAIISGIAYNAIMKCKDTDEPITVVMYFPLVATPLTFIACIIGGYVIPQGIEWLVLIGIGLLTQLAQISMTRAFHSDSAARVTPVKYVGAIYAVAAGVFIFDENLGLMTCIGIILILCGVLLNTFIKSSRLTKS
ncbi:MAG: hypothetical protein BM555_06210 [Crocinitomix sp. MedPE-SWsnd]|nr:MAG: hypothetical protein BM555_06210 [Crocinitomix sp. MedPE-SWsnd]